MDPETAEAFLILGKLALIIGGGCAVTLACMWVLVAAFMHYPKKGTAGRIDATVQSRNHG